MRGIAWGIMVLVLAVTGGVAVAQGAQWKEIPSGVEVGLRGVCYGDKLHVWAVGDKGTVLCSVDGGKKWSVQQSPCDGTLRSVHFIDGEMGWIVGDGDTGAPRSRGHILFMPGMPVTCGTCLSTTDAGRTWSRKWVNTNFQLRAIWMVSRTAGQICNHGGAAHPDGDRMLTHDGGGHWSQERVYRGLNDCFWTDEKTGWAVGSRVRVGFIPEPTEELYTNKSARIVATIDGGTTWVPHNSPGSGELYGVWFADRQHGFAVGQGGAIQSTADGGKTWVSAASPVKTNLYDVVFTDARHGWSVGAGGVILETSDGGKSWQEVPSPVKKDLLGVHGLGEAKQVAVGLDGTILRRE